MSATLKKLAIACAGGCAILCLGLGLALYYSPRPSLLDDVAFGKVVLDGDGRVLRIGLAADDRYRLPLGLDETPEGAVNALLAYEDQYFYAHPGINIFAMIRSAASLFGGRRFGASTITMQVARLKGGLVTSNFGGKCRQIWEALRLERHYAKDEILEAYFNLAPYGGNIEGLEAAARIYFDKPASRLTPLEIEALTGVPQNPVKRNPVSGIEFASARRVIRRVLGAPDEAPPLAVRRPGEIPPLAPHLALELLAGETGPTIRTYLERDLQIALEGALKDFAERGERYGLNNAAAMLIAVDGVRVAACVGSADFNNAGIEGQIDGTRARRSPGSTLKPFIYALALEQGLIHPGTILADTPRSFGGYDPENFDYGFRGPVAAADALRSSRNLPAIILAEKLKYPDLYGFLQSAGVALPREPEHYGLALALGGAETTMRELGVLYAALKNQGLRRPLKFVRDGRDSAPRRVLSPEAAWLTLKMLERPEAVVKSATGAVPYYYKTGTSNGLRDAWAVGIVGDYVLLVWAGNFNNKANPALVGAKTALPLFQEITARVVAARPVRPLGAPDGLNLERESICVATGDIARGRCDDVADVYYIPGVSPVRDSGVLRPVALDKATGLRACRSFQGEIEEVWWEFWPSDLKNIFAGAGVIKPDPPAWHPQCAGRETNTASPPPRIISPKRNVTYSRTRNDKNFRIPLLAAADADSGAISWFADNVYIGKSRPGETIFWNAPGAGVTVVVAADEAGRTSRVRFAAEIVADAAPCDAR